MEHNPRQTGWCRFYDFAKRSALRVTTQLSDRQLSSELAELERRKSDDNIRGLLQLRDRCRVGSAWLGLGSLGYELVRHLRPRHVVELGSYGGFSTCCFGLALKHHVPGGSVTAVDTWQGDLNTGSYGEEVFREFLMQRSALGLEEIIRPLRMTFKQASAQVAGPIDLLHIDGWHTFRAVTSDLRLFRPFLAKDATVLFHDVNARFLGMRWFWLLLSLRYRTAMVPYSSGLGVARLGGQG